MTTLDFEIDDYESTRPGRLARGVEVIRANEQALQPRKRRTIRRLQRRERTRKALEFARRNALALIASFCILLVSVELGTAFAMVIR